jgi:hypothetical protein
MTGPPAQASLVPLEAPNHTRQAQPSSVDLLQVKSSPAPPPDFLPIAGTRPRRSLMGPPGPPRVSEEQEHPISSLESTASVADTTLGEFVGPLGPDKKLGNIRFTGAGIDALFAQ